MLTANDLADRWGIHVKTVYRYRKAGMIPPAVPVGDTGMRWREEDIAAIEAWWQARQACRDLGQDPDGPDGPSPPVMTSGYVLFDPRAAKARQAELERQARSEEIRNQRAAETAAKE